MNDGNNRYKSSHNSVGEAVEIPKILIERLQGLGPRFCLVKAHSKDPSVGGKGWHKPENLMYADDPRLQEHLRKGGNYGIVAGFGLAILNVDHDEIKSLVLERFPKTFMWESPGHKAPVALFLSNLKEKRILRTKSGEYGGEILWEGSMAVGPGSIHPNGQRYNIICDAPLATVSEEQLEAILGDYLVPKKVVAEVEEEVREERRLSGVDLDILKVVPLAGLKKHGEEFFGPHPVHGSTTKRNFWVNCVKNVWYCFRHNVGGGPLTLLAILEGIIRCEDAGPGALRGDLFKQVLRKAFERGLIKELPKNFNQDKSQWSLGDFSVQLAGSNVVFTDKKGNPILSYVARDLQKRSIREAIAKRFKVDLAQVEEVAAQIALNQNADVKEERAKTVVKVAGLAKEGYYEAIYHEEKPAFLVYSNGQFKILDQVHEEEVVVKPPTKEMCPYPPYRYYPGPVETETLRREVFAEYDAFVDADVNVKHRWTCETFLSYQQEKLMTVLYEFLVGTEGSGKTHAQNVMRFLMYRPLWGVSMPAADIFSYLALHPFGTIIEDEIRGVEKDVDKLKVYLAGYKQGAVIPRIFDLPDGTRLIKYFPCFGFKCVAGRALVKDPAFMERFVVAYMLEGIPQKDEFTDEDVKRLLTLRDKLLKWRMQNMDAALPEVDPQVTGRLKELWKPLLQVGAFIGNEKELREALTVAYKEQRRGREESLEAAILRAILEALTESEDGYVPSEDIWTKLTSELDGSVDKNKAYLFHSSEFGDITKQLVGYRLRDGLGAQKRDVRREKRVVKAWQIPAEKLHRLVRRYICSQVAKFTASREGNRVVLHISCPYLSIEEDGSKKCCNETVAPSGACKLGNLATKMGEETPEGGEKKDLEKMTAAINPEDVLGIRSVEPPERGRCVGCGAFTVLGLMVETKDGSWGLVCAECAVKIKRENPDVEWLEGQVNSASSEPPKGLIQCEICKAQRNALFFATQEDLEKHVKAFHGGYPDKPSRR